MSDFGFHHLPNFLSQTWVDTLAEEARKIIAGAPLASPTMKDGKPLKVLVTSAGTSGWWSDHNGYRYVDRHPATGEPWPAIAPVFRDVATIILACAGYQDAPVFAASIGTVLINWYQPGASLGWHIDRTEEDKLSPIISISIGDSALFEIKDGPRVGKHILCNGDVCVQAGRSRASEHRIAKVYPGELELGRPRNPLSKPGRLNLTIRRNKVVR